MTTLFKEVGYSLSKIIEDIDVGEIGLPDIQRPFIWNNAKVRDLFDSMYRGFPVGYLLFWVNGFSEIHRQIGTELNDHRLKAGGFGTPLKVALRLKPAKDSRVLGQKRVAVI